MNEPIASPRRSRAGAAAALLLATLLSLLGACAAALGPRTITLSEAELTQRLAERFPQDRRLLELLDLRLGTPRVTLLPQLNRVAVEMDFDLSERVTQRSFALQVALDAALRVDESAGAVTLADVRLQRLGTAGLPDVLTPTVLRLGTPLVELALEGTPVHRFTPEQLGKAASRGWRPGPITVTPRGVELTLLPIEAR